MEIFIDEKNEIFCTYQGKVYSGFKTNLDEYDENKNKWFVALDMMKDCKQISGSTKLTGSEANLAFDLADLMPKAQLDPSNPVSKIEISSTPTEGINSLHGKHLDPEGDNNNIDT